MKPLRELHPEPKDKINTTTQFLFYPDEKPWEAVNCAVLSPPFSHVSDQRI